MKKRRLILLNIIIIGFVFLIIKLNYIDNVLKYISFDTQKCNFKDLLSIICTILSIFIGFIVTCITVIVSMCDKRIMKVINDMGKTGILYISMKKAVSYGLISLIGSAILYINADFNVLAIRLLILWIIINSLYIFIYYSKNLIKFVSIMIKQIFLNDENMVIKGEFKKK